MPPLKRVAVAMLKAVPNDSSQATVLSACGYIASLIIRDLPEPARRGMVEEFVDRIYAGALDLKRREKA